jgi:uncharacterized protein involved in exopolysaccharide biosynthesis
MTCLTMGRNQPRKIRTTRVPGRLGETGQRAEGWDWCVNALKSIDRSAAAHYNISKESTAFHDKIGLLRALPYFITLRLRRKPHQEIVRELQAQASPGFGIVRETTGNRMNRDTGLSIRDTLSIFYRRIVWLKFIVVALPIGVLVGCLLVDPVYESTAKVIVTGKQENATLLTPPNEISKSGYLNLNVDEIDLNSEMELLTSTELWTRTVKELRKTEPKIFAGKDSEGFLSQMVSRIKGLIGDSSSSRKIAARNRNWEVREEAEALKQKLKVTPAPKSRILDLSFKYSDPVQARKILATLLDQYIPYHLEVYSVPGALEFFSGLGKQYKQEYEKAEMALTEFKGKWGLSLPEKQKSELITFIEQIQNDLVMVNANLSQFRDMLSSLESGGDPTGQLSASMQRGEENTVINVITTQLLRAVQKRQQMALHFAPDSRDYRGAEESVELLQKRFRSTLVSQIEVLRSKKISLEKSLEEKRETLGKLVERTKTAQQLQLAVTLAKERYLQYVAKEEEARLEQLKGGSRLLNVSVVSKPFTPPEPTFPRTGLFMLAAFILAFPLGIGVILWANFLDHTFDSPKEVEAAFTGYHVIASFGRLDEPKAS